MKSLLSAFLLLLALSSVHTALAYTNKYEVQKEDIIRGYVMEKVWLTNDAQPVITVSGITYATGELLPADAKTGDPQSPQIIMGMERKKPFAVVRIPAYTTGAVAGTVNKLTGFSLDITEQAVINDPKTAARTTDVSSSVLAQGTWYKIAVLSTGFCKIDNNFITSMGLKPSDINPANIRVFGNGGNALSENNAVARPSDLTENALWVSADGNSTFDDGEFAVFYAVGPTGWAKDSVHKRFTHIKNLYTDTAYYFITFNQGAGLRIGTQASAGTPNVISDSFNYYDVHDTDIENPAHIGKLWYGEQFYAQLGNTTQSFDFDLGSYVNNLTCTIGYSVQVGQNSFSAAINGNAIGSYTYPVNLDPQDNIFQYVTTTWSGPCNSQNASITITFTPAAEASVGDLDYIELNGRRSLAMTTDQLSFRDWSTVGAGNVVNYQLGGANGNTRVWDITNAQVPVQMNGTLSGSTYSFIQDGAMLHQFAAMNSTNVIIPKYIGTVANQNLHALPQADLIIVTHAPFLSQANQLADYHRQHDNLRVVVATTDQVYNEFSSGGLDICAIRDFARMFYKRAGSDSTQLPSYLLLFGSASYDYKHRTVNNDNFVPVFESAESFNALESFSSDDFYGYLDDNEYIENYSRPNTIDLGIGRLPARTQDDATNLVNKITGYATAATLGSWRVSSTHVADKGCTIDDVPYISKYDGAGNHMGDAEAMAAQVAVSGKNVYNEEKVYVDATPVTVTPAGPRCAGANAAIDGQVFAGTFLINYNGHGNPDVWSSERILTGDDFNNWNNQYSLPFMVTATCDFGHFDQPQFVSSAEALVLRARGGVIAILTTTQAVYASYNHPLNIQYLTAQLTRNANGTYNSFGTALRNGKNVTYDYSKDSGELANYRKFALLGDPAVTPDFPEYLISMDSITDGYTQEHADTVKALGSYNVSGSVRNLDSSVRTSFNGLLSVSFFDKPRNITTLTGCNDQYQLQDNIVYKGRVTVTNGRFSFSFIAPKDLNYNFGAGKFSMYADDGVKEDAAGSDVSTAVGGFSEHPNMSSNPPIVKPYINDSLFRNGGITGTNTSLYVSLYDETGINVSGNNVGHDLTGVLDGNVESPYVLNNYYETAPNTYQRGYVTFPISGLADGKHSITVKAWDVNDNVGEGTVDFVVVDGKVTDIQQLGNYPNPFTGSTNFVFEHNHPYEQLNVQIEIYNTGGALVKNINQDFTATDSRTNEISWDGAGNNGAKLPSGVYVYRLTLTSQDGFKSTAYQKLVIVR